MGKGRAPCCDKSKVKQGAWTSSEDLKLTTFIRNHGHGNWRALPKLAGLMRCGKSCRLRWVNYLSPDVKRGNFTAEEEQTIINLHKSFGNKWSKIASYLPGRTDNEIKNVWNTHLKKRIDKMNCTKDMISSTSYASSCIMSPADDDGIQNSDKTQSEIIQEPKNPQPIIKKCYEKLEFALKEISTNPSLFMDAKEPLLNSDSPAYSYESSFSNVMPGHEVSGIHSKEKKVEIPLDFDVDDFLQIFDSLDHNDSQSNEANGERVDDQIIDPIDLSGQGESISNIASELDQNKWLLRLVESELGLRNDRNELENLSNNELQLYHGVDLMPENSSIEWDDSYSPMWPIFSPQDLGII